MLEGGYMKKNVTPITPKCGICKRLYSSKDDDGSGLCLRCRPVNLQPLLAMKRQLKQTIVMEVGKMVDDFDKEEIKGQEVVGVKLENHEQNEISSNVDNAEIQVAAESNNSELKVEDVIEAGRYGVSNSQMIPAL